MRSPYLHINFAEKTIEEIQHQCHAIIASEELWQIEIARFLVEWFDEKNHITTHSSGTTGISKEIIHSKEKMKNSAEMTGAYFSLNRNDTVLLTLSPTYIAGKMMLIRAAVLQLNLYAVAPSGHPLQNVDFPIAFTAFVPNQLYNTLHSAHAHKLNLITTLLVGGGVLFNELQDKCKAFTCNIFQTYGMTETVSHVAVRKINTAQKNYTALPNINFSTDENNCLLILAPKLSNSIIKTNDVVILHNDKEFEWMGRNDYVINCGGIKINPEVVENKIKHLFTHPFIVSSVPHHQLMNQLIVVTESNHPVDLSEINKLLHKFEHIKEIKHVTSFEYTNSGKIKRESLIL